MSLEVLILCFKHNSLDYISNYISRYSPPFNNALSLFHSLQSNNYSDFKVLNNNNNKTKYFIITRTSQATGSGLLDVFFVHSSKMADEEIVVVRESEDNPSHREASDREGELGGRQTNNNDLVQAIVADRGLITALTSAILSNIDPILKNTYSESSDSAFSSQNQPVNPGVSDDQTGMETNQVNPGVSDDQTGAESRKRAAEKPADSEKHLHAKKPRGPLTLESSAQENEVDSTAFDEEFASPNSRWEASDELSTFLGTTNKRMNKFERRSLVRYYPRPDVDTVYTPSMDDYLKPLIPGIMAPDKPLKDLQDNILDTFGPLCTMFENLVVMLDSLGNEGVVQLDKSSINSFLSCVKHALLLAGDASASINVNRRELVLKTINPLLASMAQEHFPDAKRQLFGPGFEQRLKSRSETADTIEKAAKVSTPSRGKPFFRGMAFRGRQATRGGRQPSAATPFRPFLAWGRGFRGRAPQRQSPFPRFSNPFKYKFNNQQ